MRPFSVSPHFADFREIYPTAADVARLCVMGGHQARLTLARLWLSEGIPFAFRQNPALYELIRAWIASRLGIDPKDVTLIGSARLGQSLFAIGEREQACGAYGELLRKYPTLSTSIKTAAEKEAVRAKC